MSARRVHEAGRVSAIVDEWLEEQELAGVDAIRGELARAVAAAVDADPAPYTLPRLAAVLAGLLGELEHGRDESDMAIARRLLAEVAA